MCYFWDSNRGTINIKLIKKHELGERRKTTRTCARRCHGQLKLFGGSVAEWLSVGFEIWRSRVQVPL